MAMYQTVCCQRATTTQTTEAEKKPYKTNEKYEKQIEFVPNYGIICSKMANSLLLCAIGFQLRLSDFPFVFVCLVLASVCITLSDGMPKRVFEVLK